MSHVCLFSNRIYDFDPVFSTDLQYFNRVIMSCYNRLFDQKYNNLSLSSSIHMYIKNKYNLNDYTANSIVNISKGKLKSQEELNSFYLDEKKEKLKSVEDKLKSKEKYLKSLYLEYEEINTYYQKYKDFNNLDLKDKNKKLSKLKFKNHLSNISFDSLNQIFTISNNFKKTLICSKYSIHSFQFGYLSSQIQRTRAIISKLKYSRNNLKQKIFNFERRKPKKLLWGSKKVINSRFGMDSLYFKKYLNSKRFKEFRISGRKDAKFGNFVFNYSPLNKNLLYISDISRKEINIDNIYFPYLGDELLKVLTQKDFKCPIEFGYKIKYDPKRNKNYLVFLASFEISKTKRYNSYIGDGVIGLDINFGHLDLCDISKDGNLLDTKTINFEITESSKQNEINLKMAILEAGKYINSKKKPLIKERLEFQNIKNKSKYENKYKKKMIHKFPTDKIDIFLQKESDKYEFEIFEANPAYTSFIGRIKYAGVKKINTHISASYVIGRRGLGFREKVPKKLKIYAANKDSSFKTWSQISKNLSTK